jgi:hypothetical protein
MLEIKNQEGKMTAIEVQRLLGKATFQRWSELPRDVQELLFETAVPVDGEVRRDMATVLHDHHPKTAHPPKPTQMA